MRLKNYYIVNIEGLDVSGKETFSKSLKETIEKTIVKSEPELKMEVYLHSFPTYDSKVGEKIKDMLKLDPSDRNGAELDRLFAEDRRVQMACYGYKFRKNPDVYHILIVDRYYLSNLLYSTAALVKNGDVGAQMNPMTSKAMIMYRSEKMILPTPDTVVMFSRGHNKRDGYDKVRNLHNTLIIGKGDKDANETDEFQSLVNDIYWKSFRYNIEEFERSLNVTIGDNFGNDIYENIVLDLIKVEYDKWLEVKSKNE